MGVHRVEVCPEVSGRRTGSLVRASVRPRNICQFLARRARMGEPAGADGTRGLAHSFHHSDSGRAGGGGVTTGVRFGEISRLAPGDDHGGYGEHGTRSKGRIRIPLVARVLKPLLGKRDSLGLVGYESDATENARTRIPDPDLRIPTEILSGERWRQEERPRCSLPRIGGGESLAR